MTFMAKSEQPPYLHPKLWNLSLTSFGTPCLQAFNYAALSTVTDQV